MKHILSFFILTTSFSAFAEYRVFELVIQNQETKAERIVISSLDPFQYPGYYDLGQGEIVMYRDTWMCWGETSNKKYCPKPDPSQTSGQSPGDRSLASQ